MPGTAPTPPSTQAQTSNKPTDSSSTTVENTPTGAENTPDDNNGDDEEGEGEKSQEAKIEFTQKAFNDRLNRAKGKVQNDILKALGVKNVEEARAAIEKASQADLEKLSETDRLRTEKETAEKRAEAAEKKAKRLERDREEEAAESFLKEQLRAAGIDEDLDVQELALAKLKKHVSEKFDDDADVKPEDLKPFFKSLKNDKKLWFKPVDVPAGTHGKDKNPPSSPQGSTPPAKNVWEMNRAEYAAHKRSRGLST
jgi:hypothetical protein